MDIQEKIRKIAIYGDKFVEEHLSEKALRNRGDGLFSINVERMECDWWEGLKFFLSRSFYQGRSNRVSEKVEEEVHNVLKGYFCEPSLRDKYFDELRERDWNDLREELRQYIGKNKVGRGRDIDMVISIFEFISEIPDKNIIKYSLERLRRGEVFEIWEELQSIVSIGEKIASMYLRDLVFLYGLEQSIPKDQYKYLQPVDTWVRRIAKKLFGEELSDDELRDRIIDECLKAKVSPIKFNMGVWYIGVNCIDVLIDII